MNPTPRQYEAFFLRCSGLKWAEIAKRMGIHDGLACRLGQGAARRLIQSPASPNRVMALECFPKLAAELLERK